MEILQLIFCMKRFVQFLKTLQLPDHYITFAPVLDAGLILFFLRNQTIEKTV